MGAKKNIAMWGSMMQTIKLNHALDHTHSDKGSMLGQHVGAARLIRGEIPDGHTKLLRLRHWPRENRDHAGANLYLTERGEGN